MLISQAQWGLLECVSRLLMLPLIGASFPHLFALSSSLLNCQDSDQEQSQAWLLWTQYRKFPSSGFPGTHLFLRSNHTDSHPHQEPHLKCGQYDWTTDFFFILLKLNNHMWLVVVQGSEALDYSNSAAFIAVVLFALSCQLFCSPMGCSPPGSSVHGISQTRTPERIAISFSRRYSWPRDRSHVSCTAGRFFTAGPPGKLRAALP